MVRLPRPARPGDEDWFCCLSCGRVWSAAVWRHGDWACPSSHHLTWPEFHPHVALSLLSAAGRAGRPHEGASIRRVGELLAGIPGPPAAA